MPGRDQCPKQTGSDVSARGDLRGRGTQKEYDRKGKDLLYPEKAVLTNGHMIVIQAEATGDPHDQALLTTPYGTVPSPITNSPTLSKIQFSPSLKYADINQSTI